MIKVLGTIDLVKVEPPKKPIRYNVLSKNRKKSLDVKTHHEFGELTESEAKALCVSMNNRRNGRFYWIKKKIELIDF